MHVTNKHIQMPVINGADLASRDGNLFSLFFKTNLNFLLETQGGYKSNARSIAFPLLVRDSRAVVIFVAVGYY
jgi:hypothetical protein